MIAINAARRLGSYRMALADPPGFEDLRASIAADEKALGAPAASGVSGSRLHAGELKTLRLNGRCFS